MRKNKKCFGCNSISNINDSEVNRCELYFKLETRSFLYIFSKRFCPCTSCLVKVSCRDPKAHLNSFRYIKESKKDCKLFYKAVKDFEEYVVTKNLRITRIKTKRKK